MENQEIFTQKFASKHPDEYILALAGQFSCFGSSLKDWKRFDPEKFWKIYSGQTNAIHECTMFILNVWNPADARKRGWQFDLFEFICVADCTNKSVVFDWINNPVWP